MSDTHALLNKISALRQRLEQVKGLAADAGRLVETMSLSRTDPAHSMGQLQQKIIDGSHWNSLLGTALRQVSPSQAAASLPHQLTARARHLLERGRDLVTKLRALSESLDSAKETDPLVLRHRQMVALADACLHLLATFPDAPSVQLRLCEGIEAALQEVATQIAGMESMLNRRRVETGRVETLGEFLRDMDAGKQVSVHPFIALAKSLVEEVQEARPLRFFEEEPCQPARFVAAHSINTAQVAARIVRYDPGLSRRPLDLVLAALIHDVGMLRVSADILAHPGPLTDAKKRAVEHHPWKGAESVSRLMPAESWLAEATAQHHERVDGTGYPAGLTGGQMEPVAGVLAVCDVYAALCARRPHRPAQDPRSALVNTLMSAQNGALDHTHAEKLLALGFYPAGSIVEMADGSLAFVVSASTHLARSVDCEPTSPAPHSTPRSTRPVLAILTNSQRRRLPMIRYADLAQCDGPSIVRSLSGEERRKLLGKEFPELV